jgi:hypothetical protein
MLQQKMLVKRLPNAWICPGMAYTPCSWCSQRPLGFTHEDAGTIQSIKMFFRERIVDHMIVVFTYGDQVGERNWSRMLTDKDAKYLQVHPLSRFTLFMRSLK